MRIKNGQTERILVHRRLFLIRHYGNSRRGKVIRFSLFPFIYIELPFFYFEKNTLGWRLGVPNYYLKRVYRWGN